MPEVRTFRADTMQEALAMVRREIGPDALILHTRQVSQKGMLPWQKDRVETEIVAVKEDTPGRPPVSFSVRKPAQSSPAASAANTESQPQEEAPVAVSTAQPQKSAGVDQLRSTSPKPEPEMSARLDALQKMVEELSRQMPLGSQTANENNKTENWQSELNCLLELELDEHWSRELIEHLRSANPEPASVSDDRLRLVRQELSSRIRCNGPISVQPGEQKIVALVGPTGVGKTTTIAKLASNFRLRDNLRLGLITVDTYRIAAVDQLRTYAEIIDLPMKVVTTPEEMPQAVAELADMDLILIDTAGRSPQDELRIHELKSYLDCISVDETHLVLSATTSHRNLRRTVEMFDVVRPHAAVLTKLDEAPERGAIVTLSAQLGLPISYFTTGQNVPQDIEPARLHRATDLLFPSERVAA